MNYLDIEEAKEIYAQGKNVTAYLRNRFNEEENTSEIIEIAYDLQAGSYIAGVSAQRQKAEDYACELAELIEPHVKSGDSLVDVGTGELTTLSLTLNNIDAEFGDVLAFDISWSRLIRGMTFCKTNLKKPNLSVGTFVADIKEIPLHTKCVDLAISSHALEPNGKNLPALLKELFRIVKRKLILFEPAYELNSRQGKKRMDELGYIKDLGKEVEKLGGHVIDVIPIVNVSNRLNPTACYVVEPPITNSPTLTAPALCVPGTDFILCDDGCFMASKDTGLVFPILQSVPILRSASAILATAKF